MNNTLVNCTESTCTVRDLNYAYKHWKHHQWNDQPVTKVLALHGWLDNANTFDVLIPQLLEVCAIEVIALDMAGHGLSDHRHIQAHYNIWDDFLELEALSNLLGLEQFVLMGHSRGAMVSALLSTCMPERIEKLILLDGLLPIPIKDEESPQQLIKYFKQGIKSRSRMPTYQDFDSALQARCKAASMMPDTAIPILERGLVENKEGLFEWRTDPRLMRASAFKISDGQIKHFYKAIKTKCLLLLASKGMNDFTMSALAEYDKNDSIDIQRIEGSHHFHLEEQASQDITQSIKEFLKN